MKSRKFFIAGVKFHNLKDVISDIEEGSEFDLVPDPDNKFDPNAVKIEFAGVICGFVPMKISAEISAAIEAGTELVCQATIVNPSGKTYEMCEVEISELDGLDEEEDFNRGDF
jgi:hypothetical protein